MLGTQHLWLFVVSGLLLNITPGQDTLYIVGRTLAQGRRAGLLSVLWHLQRLGHPHAGGGLRPLGDSRDVGDGLHRREVRRRRLSRLPRREAPARAAGSRCRPRFGRRGGIGLVRSTGRGC